MKQWQVYLLSALAGVLAFALAACGTEAEQVASSSLQEQTQAVQVDGAGTYTDVSVEGLAILMEQNDFPLVNVHIPYAGEIEGTDLFIPFNQIEQHVDQLPADKDGRIVLYCRSGSMSAQASRTLVELGYTDVWNVDGGMIAWRNSGRTLLNQ